MEIKDGRLVLEGDEVYGLNTVVEGLIRDALKAKLDREDAWCSYPARLSGVTEWRAKVEEMHWAFNELAEDSPGRPRITDREAVRAYGERLRRGCLDFAEYVDDLWD